MRNLTRKTLALLFTLVIYSVFVLNIDAMPEGTSETYFETQQIIVGVVDGRVRSKPSLQSEVLGEMKIGTLLSTSNENSGWYEVPIFDSNGEKQGSGWISKTITHKFDSSNPDPIFRKITDRYFNQQSIRFNNAKGLIEFLPKAADDAKTYETGGYLRLNKLLTMAKVLRMISRNRAKNPSYKEFLEKYKNEIVYSEPAGEWYVRSVLFWQLHERYRKHKIAEDIAWEAAKNPIPGECEGYVVCHVSNLRYTSGEYLNFYPNGKHSKEALIDIINLLQPIVADLSEKVNYTTASDISDRAEFNKVLADLRRIIVKTSFIEKHRALQQINQIAEGHR